MGCSIMNFVLVDVDLVANNNCNGNNSSRTSSRNFEMTDEKIYPVAGSHK